MLFLWMSMFDLLGNCWTAIFSELCLLRVISHGDSCCQPGGPDPAWALYAVRWPVQREVMAWDSAL